MKTAPCGSSRGEIAAQLLNEYMKEFQQRNPNLHVFNAVLHLDEASPHIHINFVPFYTQGRKNGLSKGVSMKQALIEQGFKPRTTKENQLVLWESSERAAMESILHQHGYVREDKGVHRAHMTVEDYKQSQDVKRYQEKLRASVIVTESDHRDENIRQLKEQLILVKHESEKLKREKKSPFMAFFYTIPEKQAFVQARLDQLGIPYHETENGFEAQQCYAEEIRKIEKEFSPKNNQREKLRNDIDHLLMMCKDFDELLALLQEEKYEVKRGKYISVKPENGGSFIRLKSLGEHYSEIALKNRLREKAIYERELAKRVAEARQKSAPNAVVLRTMQFYIVSYGKGALPMRRSNPQKPYAWTNDSELDSLLALNKKINDGASLDSLRADFAEKEKAAADAESKLRAEEKDLREFYDLKEKLLIVYEGKPSKLFTREQAAASLKSYPSINRANYRNVDALIANQEQAVRKAAADHEQKKTTLAESSDTLATAEKVFGGTFVQSLGAEERLRRANQFVPNGMKYANGGGI